MSSLSNQTVFAPFPLKVAWSGISLISFMLLETLTHSFLSVYYNWVYIAAIIIHVAPLESTVVFFLTCSYHVVLCIQCVYNVVFLTMLIKKL